MGQEWLISTPRHVQLYDAFGWKAPLFAHVGLLVDKNRQKLSKRHGDIDIASYRNNDFLPAALLNYCALLGWSPEKSTQGPSEVMHLDEMIKKVRIRPPSTVSLWDGALSVHRADLVRSSTSGSPRGTSASPTSCPISTRNTSPCR